MNIKDSNKEYQPIHPLIHTPSLQLGQVLEVTVTWLDYRQPPFPMNPATLSLDLGVLPIVPESRIAWLLVPLTCLASPIVVRRLEFFITGAVRGLRTLD